MNKVKLDTRINALGLWALLFVILARLITMYLLPLMDTTEARYAEIARLMVETGNWLVPHIDYEIPFWAKPPLSTWLSAFFISMFGFSELTVRMPSMLLALTIGLVVFRHVESRDSKLAAFWSVLFLFSSIIFFVSSGAVMTDMALCLSITFSLLLTLRYMKGKQKIHFYLSCGFVGVGMLAKGPVAPVFYGMIVILSSVLARKWLLPKSLGTLLVALFIFCSVWMPWYVAAEYQSPGFLKYFILGEHFGRFLVSGWQGDLYGNAHNEALGTIWIYLLIGGFPASVLTAVLINARYRKRFLDYYNTNRAYLIVIVCWLFLPLIFFTFSKNIIWTYTLISIPPLAIILGIAISRVESTVLVGTTYVATLVFPSVFLFAAIYSLADPSLLKGSQKNIIAQYMKANNEDLPLYYFNHTSYSAEYYSRGKVKLLKKENSPLTAESEYFLVVQKDQLDMLEGNLSEIFSENGRVLVKVKK